MTGQCEECGNIGRVTTRRDEWDVTVALCADCVVWAERERCYHPNDERNDRIPYLARHGQT